jgi:S1-C subfamily serine protease
LPIGVRALAAAVRRALYVVCAVVALASPARADDVTYTALDNATVRVFSFTGVSLERVQSASQRTYVMASPEAGHGTGLLLNRDGVVLTARHVIEGARIVAVQFPGERTAVPARVVYSDASHDCAFLVVGGTHKSSVALPERSPKLAVRQTIFVIGYPLDASRAHPQSQQGIVSGVLPDGSLQLGVALNPGNSGGPVVDSDEHLVGIAVARADPKAGAQGIGVAVPLDPILESYSRLMKGGDVRGARKDLARDGKTLTADANLLAGMLTDEDAGTAWQAVRGNASATPTSRVVDQLVDAAMQSSSTADADVLTLAASGAWNGAVVSLERGQSPATYLKTARDLAKRVRSADPGAVDRSPFLAFVLQDHEPTDKDAAPASSAGSDDSTGGGGQGGGGGGGGGGGERPIDVLIRSLETKKTIPMVRAGPTIALVTPFQLVGIGATAKLRFAELVTVNARYQYGLHLDKSDTSGSHLIEGLAGIVLGTWHNTTTTKLIVDVEHAPFATVYHYVPGEVPSTHSLVAEAGVISGLVNLKTSPNAMPPSSDFTQQTFLLEGGVRYTYFYHADSQYLLRAARSTFEASLHVVAPPLGLPDGSNNADGQAISAIPGFKADIAWDSLLSFGQTEIGGGYFPAANWVYVDIGWSYLFY